MKKVIKDNIVIKNKNSEKDSILTFAKDKVDFKNKEKKLEENVSVIYHRVLKIIF